MTNTGTSIAARKAALFTKTSTPALIGALLILEAQTTLTNEERWARAQTIDELERRYPEASAAVEAAFDADERLVEQGIDGPGVDYVAVLLAAIPTDGK